MIHLDSTLLEAKSLVSERRAFLELIQAANRLMAPEEVTRNLLVLAWHLSGCEAVAIRLKQGPGFPFAGSLGFPNHFVAPDDDLLVRDTEGRLLRGGHHELIPACLCGHLLLGQVDLALPWFTTRGSFVLPRPEGNFKNPLGLHLPGHTLNPHHLAGYQTMGIFPIWIEEQPFGLIQCNDRRPGRLQGDTTDLMEGLAARAGDLFELTMP